MKEKNEIKKKENEKNKMPKMIKKNIYKKREEKKEGNVKKEKLMR